eukprot:NODE_733_length_1231_cov_80.584239_g693_i0.p1 GENE.NODE_733_length_1231_cov_80.584239_g693_i0~~NODE_733_length_1231_cov_80.584239_g693_i0.p1  ORF type:complete len:360 (-),score=97.00 NODE_733_length_1231_cov_80.584239_g693_i0:45-1124(-)
MTEPHQLLNPPVPVSCLAFNKDRTQLALSPNNNEVHIYKKDGAKWTPTAVLKDHDKLVTGIDWAPNTNRIVSCSQDRNAYVWTWENSQWKPVLVILRINRAATQVKWSPKEDKFAVSSGARCISVCFFEEDNDWWVSKHIRKPIRSTVLSIDWHPNNVLIAAGSADFKARVFSGYIKGLDKKPDPTAWGAKMPFGELMAEVSNGSNGWVHDVRFSPDGESIAWVGHDSSICFQKGKDGAMQCIRTQTLPYLCILYAAEDSVIACGHDLNPTLYSNKGGSWALSRKLDEAQEKQATGGTSARDRFRQMDSRAQTSAGDVTLNTVHQNPITQVQILEGAPGAVKRFTTTGVDGKMVHWTFK